MSKKKNRNRHQKQVLKSFQDLGGKNNGKASDSLDKMARMATTVKADAETLIMGAAAKSNKRLSQTIKSISNFGQRLVPESLRHSKSTLSEHAMATNVKLQKLARQMAVGGGTKTMMQMHKPARSRLPYFVAVVTLLCLGGGYYAYQSISLPRIDMNISEYVDANKWLDAAAGRSATPTINNNESSVARSALQSSVASTPVAIPKSIVLIPAQPVPTKADKAFAKLPHQKKKQIWNKRLAKLEKVSTPDKRRLYKKTSYKKTDLSVAKSKTVKADKKVIKKNHKISKAIKSSKKMAKVATKAKAKAPKPRSKRS